METPNERVIGDGFIPPRGEDGLCVLPIIGVIEGHSLLPEPQKATKYEHLIPFLTAFERDPQARGLLILLNTVGGDVEAGLAIAELIAGLSKPTVSLVLGGGHSIGVPLAVSANRSFIAPSASMTLHPVRLNGLVIGAPQTFTYLTRMQERINAFITSHSRISDEVCRRLMYSTDSMATDIGSILSGEDAVQCGLIDRIGTLADAIRSLNEMAPLRNEKPPSVSEKPNGGEKSVLPIRAVRKEGNAENRESRNRFRSSENRRQAPRQKWTGWHTGHAYQRERRQAPLSMRRFREAGWRRRETIRGLRISSPLPNGDGRVPRPKVRFFRVF